MTNLKFKSFIRVKCYSRFLIVLILLNLISENRVGSKCAYKPCGPDDPHTMCKYPAKLDKTQEKCTGKESIAGLKHSYRKAILDRHNELRQTVAQGKAKGQPPAANMMKLRWNMELEEIAQRFVNSCPPSVAHDSCRPMKDGTSAGQNSAMNYFRYKEHPNKTQVVEGPADAWYSEIDKMDPSYVDDFAKGDFMKIGHYTQLVWAKSDRIGCGYLEYNHYDDMFQYILLNCNYAEAGNLIGGAVYIKGEACSQCPKGTHCSKRYPGLCTGEKDEYKDIPDKNKHKHKNEKKEKEHKNGKDKGKDGGKDGGSSYFGGPSWSIVLPVVFTCFQNAL